jgi:broad specificity phosphatase PhoE
MGRLLLIRHAQASFLQRNYDKLSELGEQQARLLGQFWVRHKMHFARVCTGPAVRHKDTARIVADVFRQACLAFPAPTVAAEFDEYCGESVMEQTLPGLLERDTQIRGLHRAFEDANQPAERLETFQRLFQSVIEMWASGEISCDGVESWDAFSARVNRGLSTVLSAGSHGERLAIFTSGGPTSVAVQRALDLSPQITLRVSWMPQNCSYSEFLFSRERFTMSTFNSFPHLDDPALQTYR